MRTTLTIDDRIMKKITNIAEKNYYTKSGIVNLLLAHSLGLPVPNKIIEGIIGQKTNNTVTFTDVKIFKSYFDKSIEDIKYLYLNYFKPYKKKYYKKLSQPHKSKIKGFLQEQYRKDYGIKDIIDCISIPYHNQLWSGYIAYILFIDYNYNICRKVIIENDNGYYNSIEEASKQETNAFGFKQKLTNIVNIIDGIFINVFKE